MNIQDWTLYYDNLGPLSCQAPCTMYSVLYDHGKIPDPFYGTNERELQYLAEKDCVFESVFSAPPALLTREHIELVFHGLDTICHIYLNGTLLGKGTAAELKDKGLFGSEGTVHECYRKRGGVYKPGGVTRMEMELCQKRIRHPMKLPDQPAKVKRKPIGGVIDPSALAYDVHDLMIYNEKARKIGKPELTYGYWAEKGKPATT